MQAIAATEHPKKTLGKLFGAAMQRWQCGEYDGDYSETWPQFQARSIAALNDIVAQSVGQHSVVFSSGGVISTIVGQLLGLDAKSIFQLNWSIANTSITTIRLKGNDRQLLSLNEHHFIKAEDADLLTWI